MKQILERIGIGLLILFPVLFFGPWLLNLFGIVSYKPPMSQNPENVVQVDFLEYTKGESRILHSLTEEEIAPFMEVFLELDAKRYANDPSTEYGQWVVRLCYADGGYDLLGGMVEFFSSTGESINSRGWYYLPRSDLEELFAKYVP